MSEVEVRVSQPKWMTIAGWVVTAIPALLLLVGGVVMLFMPVDEKGMAAIGYPAATARPIQVVMVACAALYAFPPTAVLGAILLTGYLGGATASHVRVGDPAIQVAFPVIFGVLVWLGLFLRDPRVRALVPWRK